MKHKTSKIDGLDYSHYGLLDAFFIHCVSKKYLVVPVVILDYVAKVYIKSRSVVYGRAIWKVDKIDQSTYTYICNHNNYQ